MIGAFGEHGFVSHFFDDGGNVVAIDQFSVAENFGRDAETIPDHAVVQFHLFGELLQIVKRRQRMGIGFREQFHAARVHKAAKTVNHLGLILGELFQRHAGDGKRHFKTAVLPPDQLQKQLVHGQIAFAGHFFHNGTVGFGVFVEMILSDVKEAVVSQSVGLVNLKVKAE